MLLPISEAARRLRQWGAPALYHDALNGFAAAFPGEREVIFVRAPGRVNVIGEHTDYNGLPVMPVALDREIVICLSARADNQVRLTNLDVRFEPVRFALSGSIDPYQTGHWANYAKAAAQALWQWVEQESPAWLPLRGLSGCVAGNIPPGSGLSSSSALVVAAAVALVEVNTLPIRAAQLADLLARGERYVGTEGGGMDQAVSLLAEAGSALKIDFFPLRTRPVRLPVDHLLVVANTMVSANKTGGARVAYNTRLAECRHGVELLIAISRKQHPDVEDAALLSDIVRIVPEWRDALEQMPSSAVSLSEAAGMTGLTQEELTRRCLVRRDGGLLPVPEQGFQPTRRCRHVLK